MCVKVAGGKWGSSTSLSPIWGGGSKKLSGETGGHKNFSDSNKNVPSTHTHDNR